MFQSVCCVLSVLHESQGRKTVSHPEPRRCCSPRAASTLKAVPLQLDLLGLVLTYRAHTARPSLGHFIIKLLNSIQGQYRIMPLIRRVSPWIRAHEQRWGAVCGGAEETGYFLRQDSLARACKHLYAHGSSEAPSYKLLHQGECSPFLTSLPKGGF